MEADISPEPALNAKCDKTNSINQQYDGEALQEQSCMVWGNVPFESESKGCEIRRRNQPKLCADHKGRPGPKH
jgi:hypothetical protein